jgi:CheY-like chemotaxis protein
MLVDIGLPELDGYEVARRVRAIPGLRELPLVALTGFGREEDRERALAAGFDHHLTKPVDPSRLRTLVARLAGSVPAA